MRRLARHLLTFCSAASLLLCVAVCVLWVRSYWAEDSFARGSPFQIDQWASRRGRVFYRRIVFVAPAYRDNPKVLLKYPPEWYAPSAPADDNTDLRGPHVLGFAYTTLPTPGVGKGSGGSDGFLSMPHALPALLLAAPPALTARRLLR